MRDRSRAAAFLPLGLALSLCLGLIGPGLIAMFVTFVALIFAVTTLGARGHGPIAAVVAAVGATGVLLLRSPLPFAIAPPLLVGMVLAVARPTLSRAVIAGSVAGLSWLALALSAATTRGSRTAWTGWGSLPRVVSRSP